MRSSFQRFTYALVISLLGAGLLAADVAAAEYRNRISYPGAAWGPDGDTVYFLKQIVSAKSTKVNLMGGAEPVGNHVWLCEMKWDGSEKKEIAELWPGQDPYIDTQGGPAWMEVNVATSNVTFGVEFGSTAVGIWVVGLDGKNLHRPFEPVGNDKEKQVLLHPSWSPDGTKLVFEEHVQGMRLGVYDLVKKERRQLTQGPRDQQPVWSPNGEWIAYMHCLQCDAKYAKTRIWLTRPDSSEQKPVVDEKDKPVPGWWPSWSPDGRRIGVPFDTLTLVDLSSHSTTLIDPLPIMGERLPYTFVGHHWGKRGWLLSAGVNIVFINEGALRARLLAGGGVYTVAHERDLSSYTSRWGLSPTDLTNKN